MEKNIWIDGMMGLVVEEALGGPVQFMSRENIKNRTTGSVTGMESGGAYCIPKEWLLEIKKREWIESQCINVLKS